MKRKSPIEHHVRAYERQNGTSVHDYVRGHGVRSPKLAKPRFGKKDNGLLEPYGVIIRYDTVENIANENFVVSARDYPGAVDSGLMSRLHITPPYMVEVARLE